MIFTMNAYPGIGLLVYAEKGQDYSTMTGKSPGRVKSSWDSFFKDVFLQPH